METFGKRWQLRLLAGLLAIFVTLYFTADLFGGIRADDGATIEESIDSDEDTSDGEEKEDSAEEDEDEEAAEDEESEEEDELMLLAAAGPFDILDPDSPFVIDSVVVTLNRVNDQKPGTVVDPNNPPDVWDGENFDLLFTWHIKDSGSYDNYAGTSFYYDQLTHDLAGISIGTLNQPFDPLNPGQGSYSIDGGVLMINIGDQLDVYKYTGSLNVSGKIKLEGLPENEEGKFTIHFGKDYTLDLIAPSLQPGSPNLGVQKTASGEVYKDPDGNFYQDFTVTISNSWGAADATNVVLEDQHGSIFTDDLVGLQLNPPRNYTLDTSGKYPKLSFDDPIKVNETVTLTYHMKITDTSLFVNGHDNTLINSNKAIATADKGAKAESSASAKFKEPTITKDGSLSPDGKTIEWTITVEPGIFENTAWFPGESFTIDDPMFPAGTSVTFTNADFVDGKYVYNFTTDAPKANVATDQTVENTATVTVEGESKDAYEEVKISASAPGTIDKSHDDNQVTIDDDGIATIPWKIVAEIPDTELESLKLHGEIDSAYLFDDPANGVDLSSFKLTVNGKTYTVGDKIDEWSTKHALVSGTEKIGEIDVGWGSQCLGYDIYFDESALGQLRNQIVEIAYNFFLNEPSVTNRVTLTITPKGEPSVSPSDSDTYEKPDVSLPFKAEKNWDNYNSGALSTSGRYPVGWRIDVLSTQADSFKAGNVITITDTLPKEYELIDDSESFLRTNGDNWPQTQVTDTPVHTVSKNGDTVTIRVTLNDELANELKKEGSGFSVLFVTQMKENVYLTETAKGSHTLQIVNRAKVTFKGGTIPVSKDIGVTVNGSNLLNKTGDGELNADNTGLTATYTIEVNKDAYELRDNGGSTINGGADLHVVDELGTSLKLVEGSVKIEKYVLKNVYGDYEDWGWETTTADVSYNVNGQKIEFVLKDNTYYRITYNVTGTILDGDDLTDPKYPDEMAQEIKNRYDNSVSVALSGGTTQSHSASLDSSSFRTQGAISYKFTITGTKRWPGGSNVKQIDLKLTQTEHVIDLLVPKLGQDITTVRTYHLVTSNADLKLNTATDIYKKVTIDSNGSWLFTIDDLVVSDLKGSSYSYTIQEQNVPGYIPNYSFRPGGANEWEFQGLDSEDYVIRYQDNSSVEVLIQNAKTSSVIKPGNIYVKKSDSDDASHAPVPGATFKLKMTDPHNGGHDQTHTLAGVQIPDATNVTRLSDTEITFVTTDVPAFINNLPADHTYSIEETVPPSEFALGAKEVFNFGIRASGSTYAISKNSSKYVFDLQGGADLDVRNERLKVSGVTIQKTDGTTKLLSGAVIKITEKNGTSLPTDTVDVIGAAAGSVQFNQNTLTFTTAGTAVTVTGLPEGRYTVSEEKAPSGYALTTAFKFTVEEDGTVSGDAGNGSNTLGANNTITLKDKLNKITLEKKDEDTGTLLSGAKFEIAAPAGVDLTKTLVKVSGANSVKIEQTKLTFTTTSKAATITGLPAGTYTLTETAAPTSYNKPANPSQTFTIKTDGTIDDVTNNAFTIANNAFTVTNKMITADITVKKVGSDDPDTILANARFTLAAKNPVDWSKVTFNGTAGSGTSVSRDFTTVSTAFEIKGLPVGTYTLTEKQPPDDYLSTDPFTFSVTDAGTISTTDARYASGTVTLTDEKPEAGTLEISKIDAESGIMLPGAEFELTRADGQEIASTTPDNNVNATLSDDHLTLTFTTTAQRVRIKGLAAGTYVITETKAPSGYIPAAPQNVPLKTDVSGNVLSESTSVENTATEISISKIDMTSAEQLPGAELTIRGLNKDFTNVSVSGAENDHVDRNNSTLTFTTTDQLATVKGLPAGDYTLTETIAPDGYAVTTEFYFTIDKNGNVSETANVNNGNNTLDETAKKITLKDDLTEISINKVDMTSQKQLPGAKLTISTVSGSLTNAPISITETGGTDIPFTASVNELSFTTTDKTATIKGLPAGDYTLTETVAPDGYAVTTEFYFTIDKNGNISETANADNGNNTLNGTAKTITLNDKLTDISINKIDMSSQKQLPGAELFIKNANGDSVEEADVKNADSVTKRGSTLTFTTTDKTATIKGLPAGDYTLTEITAPGGYAKTTTTFRFTINPDGTVTGPTNTTTPANEPGITLDKPNKLITVENAPLAAITIVKEYLEEGSNKKIAPTAALLGATSFGLFSDAQCNAQIGTAVSPDTNGEVTFSDLADGTYYVKEISSPAGYKRDKTVYKFDVLLGKVTCYNAAGGTVTVKPTYTNISTTTIPTDTSESESESGSEGSETSNSSAETEITPESESSENTTDPPYTGTRPTGSRPSGGTRPTGTTAPTTVTTAPTTATTSSRSTLTEPDEIEPEKTTAKTKKTKKTKKTTVAPETNPSKTTAVGTERTDIAIGVNQVTREPGIGIDSNLTTDEENPNTGVSLAPLTAAFAAAGTLAVVTRKKKKK